MMKNQLAGLMKQAQAMQDNLEDLVAAAFNDAVRRAEDVSQEKMGRLTAGMPMPPGMKFPF